MSRNSGEVRAILWIRMFSISPTLYKSRLIPCKVTLAVVTCFYFYQKFHCLNLLYFFSLAWKLIKECKKIGIKKETMDCHEIDHIHFGILSSDDILRMSVCELNSTKLVGPNSVYDPRMGILELDETCPTCQQNSKHCIGHFAHINLNVPVLHPLYHRSVSYTHLTLPTNTPV